MIGPALTDAGNLGGYLEHHDPCSMGENLLYTPFRVQDGATLTDMTEKSGSKPGRNSRGLRR
jgi:hypothetical protein